MFSQVIVAVIIFHKCASTQTKCSDARNGTYSGCHLDYNSLQLFCDYTNLTRLPDPDDKRIRTQTHPGRTKQIYLNNSCVDVLERSVLSLYSHLVIFNCANNDITQIDAQLFSGNNKLAQLVLSWNRITSVDDDAFKGLNLLEKLFLRGNRLVRVNRKVLHPLGNLRTLDLSDNQLHTIHRQAFLQLQQLENLNLRGNNLNQISQHIFSGLIQLQILNIGSNSITSLPDGLFTSTLSIEAIDLSNNNITCLSDQLLHGHSSVSSLRLNGNNLKTPLPNWYRNVLKLKKFKGTDNLLSRNPWLCDCSLHRYKSFLREEVTDEKWKKILDVECFSPPIHRGKGLSSLDPHTFDNCTVGSIINCEDFQYTPFPNQHPPESEDDDSELSDDADDLDDPRSEDEPPVRPKDIVNDLKDANDEENKVLEPIPANESKQQNDIWKYVAIGAAGLVAIIISVIYFKFKYRCTKRETKKDKKSDDELTAINPGPVVTQTSRDPRIPLNHGREDGFVRLPVIPHHQGRQERPTRFPMVPSNQDLVEHSVRIPLHYSFGERSIGVPLHPGMEEQFVGVPLQHRFEERREVVRARDRDSGCSVGSTQPDNHPFHLNRVTYNRRSDCDYLNWNNSSNVHPESPFSGDEVYHSILPPTPPRLPYTNNNRNEVSAPQLIHSV